MGTQKFFRDSYFTGNSSFAGNITSAGSINASSGIVGAVSQVSTTAALVGQGLVTLSSTAAGVTNYVLPTPVAGSELDIVVLLQSGSSSSFAVRTATTGVVISSTGGADSRTMTLSNVGEAVTLQAVSSTQWAVSSHVGVAFTTST